MTTLTNKNISQAQSQQISQLALSGDIPSALQSLSTIKQYEAIATNLSNKYSSINNKANNGLITTEFAEVEFNNIAAAIFELLSEKEPSLSQSLAAILPSLPPNYIQREEFANIEDALLRQTERYYGIAGMEGIGKTSLAVAIAHSKKIQLAFEGAIFWVGVGETVQQKFIDSSAVPYQEQLFIQLGGDLAAQGDFKTWQHGLVALQKLAREKLADKKCLIIVDDVHATSQLLEAVDIHENAIFLVITSDESHLRAKGIKAAATFRIGGMNHEQALQLLLSWSENNSHAAEANEIVSMLGYHPLAIVMAGANIKGAIDARSAWSDVLEAIKESALDEFSLAHKDDLRNLVKISLERLNEEELDRYHDLSIFPENWQFDLDKLFVIWNDESERKIRRFIQNLVDKALLRQVGDARFSLYNLPRLYMRTHLQDALPVFNKVMSRLMPTKPILTIAVAWYDEAMVETLLKNKSVDISEENVDGLIPLQVASIQGNAAMVQLLLKHGAPIDQKNIHGKTALILAAQFGHIDVVDVLLKNKADIDAADLFGFTALHNAAELGYLDIAQLLLANGATPDIKDNMNFTPLYLAASMNNTAIILELLKHRPIADYITNPKVPPFWMAAGNSHFNAMKILLDAGDNINFAGTEDGLTFLHHMASQVELFPVAEFLVKEGANLNLKDNFHHAPLHYAAEIGYVEFIKLLLAAGADANVRDDKQLTPMHYAIRKKHAAVVSALIQGGADVNARSTINMTPLHTAAGNLNGEIVQMLLQANADVKAVTTDEYAPLHTALYFRGDRYIGSFAQKVTSPAINVDNGVYTDGLSVIELLLKHGAQTEAKVNTKHYPIHFAISYADVEAAKLLIDAGASMQVKDADGKTVQEFIAAIASQPLLPQIKKRLDMIAELVNKV